MADTARAGSVEGGSTKVEPAADQTQEEQQPATEGTQGSEQQLAEGKAKPPSEKIWGSFLKSSGLGKVMGGRKKKEAGTTDANGEGVEQEKSPTHGPPTEEEGPSRPSSPKEQEPGLEEQCTENEPEKPESEEVSQEPVSSSNKDAKPKQGEKSSMRDFIRKPVSRIFSHKSTEKKDCESEAQKPRKTRSKSLDRLENAGACQTAAEQTDELQAAGEPNRPAPHEAKHMKRWHSFKKMMVQKSLKKSTEDPKDMDGAEGDLQVDAGTMELATTLDHAGHKKWKLKRSWTFQGLKRDSSVIGIHKPKGSDKVTEDNLKGDETSGDLDEATIAPTEEAKPPGEEETQEKENAEEEKASAAHHAKSDHHANEIWTSFKKRVAPKSKKSTDHVGTSEEEQTGEGEKSEEQAGHEPCKSAKQKRTHFNRAVSLKNFLLRKGKSASVDTGETAATDQKEVVAEGTEDAPANTGESPSVDDVKDGMSNLQPDSGNNDQADTKGTKNEEEMALKSSDQNPAEEETQAEPASEPTCSDEGVADTKVCLENGSTSPGCGHSAPGAVCTSQSMNGKGGETEDSIAHDHEMFPLKDVIQEEAKQEDLSSQEELKQKEKACSSSFKDDKILAQEQCTERKSCSGSPVAQSGECVSGDDCCDLPQSKDNTTQSKLVLGTRFELELSTDGPPQDGGSHPGSGETDAELDDQEEDRTKMFFEAAASIVQTVVSAAAEQIANEKDFLDNGFMGSYPSSNDSHSDLDVKNFH